MVESLRSIDDAHMFEIVEEDQGAEAPLLFLGCRLQHHVKLAGRRPLHHDSIFVEDSPYEAGAVVALHACGAPDVGPPEILLDRTSQTGKKIRSAGSGTRRRDLSLCAGSQ